MCAFTRTHTHAHRYAAKTHRFTAGITQLSASSIPHLLHVCFSVSLLFLFSSPQATSPSPRLSTRFNPFLFCPRSRSFYQHPLPVTCFSPPMFSPTHRGLFVSPFSSTSLHAKVVSLFASVSQQASDSNMWGGGVGWCAKDVLKHRFRSFELKERGDAFIFSPCPYWQEKRYVNEWGYNIKGGGGQHLRE